MITAIRFPIRLLSVALVLTTMAFVGFGWIIFDARRDAVMFGDRLSRIEELRGVIVHLDEVLTMSARMAATTGDSRWEERYHHFEPQLDAAIKETIKIGASSSNIKAATKTDVANSKLVEMENRAFALVRAGRKEEAQTVLFSSEYETQKQIYAEGILSFVNQIRREFDEHFRDDQRLNLLSIIAALFVGGTSFVAWLSVARSVRRWRAQLLDSFHRQAEAEENLRKVHAELEVRVKERTAELARANEALQAENSERKQAEMALSRLAAIVESSGDAIIGKDLNGIITSWNKGAEEIFGYEASEMMGASIMRLIPTDLQDEEDRIKEKVRRGENVESFETLRQTKDGRLIDISVTASAIKDVNGKVIGVSKVARDITERKRAEEELKRSQSRLADAQRIARVGSWDWDLVTGKRSWSDQFFRLLGFEPGEIEPSHGRYLACVHPDDRKAAEQLLEDVLATQKPASADVRVVHPDGEVRILQMQARVIVDDSGKVVRRVRHDAGCD